MDLFHKVLINVEGYIIVSLVGHAIKVDDVIRVFHI